MSLTPVAALFILKERVLLMNKIYKIKLYILEQNIFNYSLQTFVRICEVKICDMIPYKNKVWLVPEWIERPDIGMSMPVRIISLEEPLKYYKVYDSTHNFVLDHIIPRYVLNGKVPNQLLSLYTVQFLPPISFPSVFRNRNS